MLALTINNAIRICQKDLKKDFETDKPHFKTEKFMGSKKIHKQYNFKVNQEIDRINSNTKYDDPTSGVFRDNTGTHIRIDSR